ncbi:hypothetical protein Tco_0892522 [Tanacetum coccineum]|uniref:Uncharacterized protein n=1 Tax=Tanacetum coccineum TaxID=301880 RepID=A0ABQ5C663_9ASTR
MWLLIPIVETIDGAENCDNAGIVYSFLDSNKIGETHSVFYIAYASHLESRSKLQMKYTTGISRYDSGPLQVTLYCLCGDAFFFFLSDSSKSDDYGETGQDLFETSMVGSPFISRRKRGGNGVLIVADIQEVIGSILAIKIWTNGVVPIRAGVLITAGLIVSGFIATLCGNYVDYGGISAAPPPPPPPPTKEKAPKSPKE